VQVVRGRTPVIP